MKEQLCKINIDVAFYLKGNIEILSSNKHFDELCIKIKQALETIVDNVEIDYESFEVLD